MAEAGVYYDELRRSAISKDSIVRCQRVGERGFLFKFRLSQLDYRPLFASLVLRFWDPLNLKNYLALDNEAAFTFAVNNFENALDYELDSYTMSFADLMAAEDDYNDGTIVFDKDDEEYGGNLSMEDERP